MIVGQPVNLPHDRDPYRPGFAVGQSEALAPGVAQHFHRGPAEDHDEGAVDEIHGLGHVEFRSALEHGEVKEFLCGTLDLHGADGVGDGQVGGRPQDVKGSAQELLLQRIGVLDHQFGGVPPPAAIGGVVLHCRLFHEPEMKAGRGGRRHEQELRAFDRLGAPELRQFPRDPASAGRAVAQQFVGFFHRAQIGRGNRYAGDRADHSESRYWRAWSMPMTSPNFLLMSNRLASCGRSSRSPVASRTTTGM